MTQPERELWSELPPNRQRRARGQPEQKQQQQPPTTKTRHEHQERRPNGNKRPGRQRRPDHTKLQTAQRKTNQNRKKETKGAKTQTSQAKPRYEAHDLRWGTLWARKLGWVMPSSTWCLAFVSRGILRFPTSGANNFKLYDSCFDAMRELQANFKDKHLKEPKR